MIFQRKLALCAWMAAALLLVVLAGTPVHGAKPVQKAPSGKNKDLVVLEYDRWLDTLKGAVKNFGKASARDVTVVVRFQDRKKKVLGTQRVSVGDLRSGEQSTWSLAIQERNRSATSYQFEVHAIWK